MIYSNVTCGGWETSITQCNKMTYPNTACSRRHIAGVLCGYGKMIHYTLIIIIILQTAVMVMLD